MQDAKDRRDEAKKGEETVKTEVQVATELFQQLSPDAQNTIIDLIKSLLSEK